MVSFVKGGLEDLSVSRTTLDWGIPGARRAAAHHVRVGRRADQLHHRRRASPTRTHARWRYWPADVHVIGKDIVRFHAVYWPAFLMSAGIELPKRVFAHGFLFNRGEKMSKSVGNVVDPFDLVKAYGVDQVRYFFLREVVFGQDGNYSHEAIVNRINADLANDLGNLAQRSLSMIAKNCDGKIPEPGALTDADKTILAAADGLYAKAREAMDRQGIKHYLDAVWAVVADANRYFAGEEPWAKRKTEPQAHGHDPLRDGGGGAAGGDPGGAGDAALPPASCSMAWGREPTRARSGLWARRGACGPARRSRRRPACSRATSSRRRPSRSRRRSRRSRNRPERRDDIPSPRTCGERVRVRGRSCAEPCGCPSPRPSPHRR